MPLRPLQSVAPLAAGARVALVAPAGTLRGEHDVERAHENARDMGWEPIAGQSILRRDGYFAGTDEQRLADLNWALAHRRVDGIWCIRGGYGTARLLPAVDFAAARASPRPVLGFSDVTALHCALQRLCGLQSFHGPVARVELTSFTRTSLSRAVVERVNPCGTAEAARVLRGGRAEGVLAGGNLAVLTSLAGTPYAPDLDGAILVLEDIDERTYRVDRMLRQLYLAGMLTGCRAVVFGACTNCAEETESGARPLDTVLREMADMLQVPCIAGVPVGHIADQWTLPLGKAAVLDADNRTLDVID